MRRPRFSTVAGVILILALLAACLMAAFTPGDRLARILWGEPKPAATR